MKYIRKPQRVDALRTEPRVRKRGRFGKYIYIGLLLGLGAWAIDLTAGSLLYLKAEGMVTREAAAVASEHTARIVSLDVSEGSPVTRGSTVARLSSQEMADSMAKMTTDLVRYQVALGEMKLKRGRIDSMLPDARRRAAVSEEEWRKVEEFKEAGMITIMQRARVVHDAYDSVADLRELELEAKVIASQVPELERSVQRAQASLDHLRTAYAEGILISPVDGTASEVRVQPGAVVRPGEPIMRIYHGESYVLAYVPTGTLYTVKPGDAVQVRTGFQVLTGKVAALLPVASQLPQEFQKAFESTQREQLVRIAIDPGQQLPPLFTTVEVAWDLSPVALVLRSLRG